MAFVGGRGIRFADVADPFANQHGQSSRPKGSCIPPPPHTPNMQPACITPMSHLLPTCTICREAQEISPLPPHPPTSPSTHPSVSALPHAPPTHPPASSAHTPRRGRAQGRGRTQRPRRSCGGLGRRRAARRRGSATMQGLGEGGGSGGGGLSSGVDGEGGSGGWRWRHGERFG